MSWRLFFYRRVGQPALVIEEVDPLFERMPRFTRVPPREADPLARSEVLFRYYNPINDVTFDFAFQSPAEEEPEAPGEVDFPYELTPLELRLHYLQSPELAQEAIPVAADICQQLDLLVLNPQAEQELPVPPDVNTLIQSYIGENRAVEETMAWLHQRPRRYKAIALAFLIVGLALLLLAATGVLR